MSTLSDNVIKVDICKMCGVTFKSMLRDVQ